MAVNETIERIVFQGVDQITAASKSAEASTKQLKATIDGVKSALGAIGVTVGAGAFVNLHLDVLKATAALDDMAEATGASVEKLSAIRNVARVGGQDFEGLTGQIGRMVRGLKDNTDEGNKSIAALGQLGISARDVNGHWRDTGQILIDVAQKMGRFRSDADRVAFVQDALGKGAERYIPLLKDMAAGTDLVTKETTKQAAAAEEAEKNINRLKISMEDARKETVNQFTPAIIQFTEKLLAANAAMGGFWQGLNQIMTVSGEQAADPLGSLAQVEERLKKLREMRAVLGGPSLGAMANRLFAPEDLAVLDKQIAYATAQQKILSELAKRQITAGGKDKDSPFFEFAGGGIEKPLDYQPLDPRRLTPSQIAKQQAQGQEDFNAEVRKWNVEQNKASDDRQKIFINGQELMKKSVLDRIDAEQEAAIEQGAAFIAIDNETYTVKLDRLRETLGVQEDMELQALEKRKEFIKQFSDDELADYGGRLAIMEGMDASYQAQKAARQTQMNATIREAEMRNWALAANLLAQFAGKNKAAALAVIAINKGLAAAQVVVNTEAAIARAYAELGYVGGTAAAASLRAQEFISLALIAAAGIVEGSQVVSGGGGGGTAGGGFSPAVPTFQADPVSGAPRDERVIRQSITIRFVGEDNELIRVSQARELAETIADATEHGARVFIER